jgi:hypothetical protein
VLGHPAFVAGDVGGDAQGEALLAQQSVASVTGTVAPDLAGLGEVDDVLLVVAWPGNVSFAWSQRRASGVHAGNDALLVLVDLAEDLEADAGHDAHVDDGVGRIGELDADAGHGGADRAHAVGQNVHGSAAHGAAEEGLELAAHDEGIFPVIGRSSVVPGERADEGPVFHASDVVGRGTGVETAWPKPLVEPCEGSCIDELLAEPIVLFLRAVDPVDCVGLAKIGHLFDPANEVLVCRQGRLDGGCLGVLISFHEVFGPRRPSASFFASAQTMSIWRSMTGHEPGRERSVQFGYYLRKDLLCANSFCFSSLSRFLLLLNRVP